MVRSNFPGKPRSGHRKLISASSCATVPNEASLVAENIYHGLSAFNATFGLENEQIPTFHGFSPHQVSEAQKAAESSYKHVENEFEARGVIFVPFLPNKKSYNRYQLPGSDPCEKTEINSRITLLDDKENAEKLDCDEESYDNSSEIPVRNNFGTNSCKSRKTVLRENPERITSSNEKSSPNLFLDLNASRNKLNNSLNSKKFVLPCRSNHSSRVIKPNKRFLDFESEETEVTCPDTSENIPTHSSSVVQLKKPKLIFNENVGKETSWKINSTDNPSSNSFTSTPSTSKPSSHSKGILREAILNIELSPIKTDGPKFTNRANANTVVCGVCGAVRFYKFTKQTRKFGINSCESCRKFIGKMINLLPVRNAAAYSGGILECHNQKGRIGQCNNPSIIRNKEWNCKSAKSINEQRCLACWLNTCIRKYNIPSDKKIGLSKMVPEEMRITEFRENSSGVSFGSNNPLSKGNNIKIGDWQKTHEKFVKMKNRRKHKGALNSLNSVARIVSVVKNRNQSNESIQRKVDVESRLRIAKNLRKRTSATLRSKRSDLAIQKLKKNAKDLNKKSKLKKLKKLIRKNKEKRSDSREVTEEKRDKYFMKGPRVKHVCRSASVVLGQPVATFPIANSTTSNNSHVTKSKETYTSQETAAFSTETRIREVISQPSNSSSKSSETSYVKQNSEISPEETKDDSKKAHNINASNIPAPNHTLARTLQDLGKQQEEVQEVRDISIDFWENYDPEEVCKTGFALIATEPIHVQALCFLCGSAGVDKLIHCVSCCEAYHQYCVEMNMHPSKLSLNVNWWRVDWVCPKCTFCAICCDVAPQLTCQRCQKSYHSNCLSPNRQRPQLTDRTWVCPSCLRCKSCNQTNVYKFIGNLPLCTTCFKLRQKGNFCPLCQRCYEDNDYDSKMMECGKCKCWVHAKCEGLSNEKYQVLSYLPESVEFICRMCCDIPPAPWWLAVEEELKTGYLNVLKCLSKNKKACDILKWSPKKRTSQCICRNSVRVRTLRFSESSTNGTKSIRDSDSKCLKDFCDSKQNEIAPALSDSDLNENEAFNLSKLSSNNVLNSSNLLKVNVENGDCQGFDTGSSEKNLQFSPLATQSDSGIGSTDDELKVSFSIDEESNCDERSIANGQCFCSGLETWTKASPTLLSIKKKVNGNEYSSLLQFHEDVESVINCIIESEDLTKVYHETIQEVFPWFDPKSFKVYDSHSSCDVSIDDSLDFETNQIVDNNQIELDENMKSLLSFEKDYYYLGGREKDLRICILCKGTSEGLMFEEGRLLYCGHNEWVHSNCALWSSEVFEEIDGSLQNVHSAISRGKMIRCSKCSKKGASIGCCSRNCVETFHFPCARLAYCTFLENKTIHCHQHSSNTVDSKTLKKAEEFHISRPVYVELERKKKKFVDYQSVVLAVGSLQIFHLGRFEPNVSDTPEAIIPVEFHCARLFWSAAEPWKLIPYYIKTILLESVNEYDVDSDHNYTVNHSIIEESLEEVNLAVCEVVSLLCDSVCTKEDEANAEVHNNVNDLLSEQETIFEDLPNEFFDGVFKDICSKMMSIEDLVAAGDKDDSNQSDSDANNPIEMSEDDSQNCASNAYSVKKTCFEFPSNSLSNIAHCEKAPKPINCSPQQSESSKCKLLNKNVSCGGNDDTILHVKIQDSCSSIKTNSICDYLKKTGLNSLQLLQVDGIIDDSSCSDSCSSIDESDVSSVEDEIQFPNYLSLKDSYRILELYNRSSIPQIDGMVDVITTNENEENPVQCCRCHRTYRTDLSYQRHLSSCSTEYISSSESDYGDEDKPSSVHELSFEAVNPEVSDSTQVSEIKLINDVIVTTPSSLNNVDNTNNVEENRTASCSNPNFVCNSMINADTSPNRLNVPVELTPNRECPNSVLNTNQIDFIPQQNVINKFSAQIDSGPVASLVQSSCAETTQYLNCVNGKGRPIKMYSNRKKVDSPLQPIQYNSSILNYHSPQPSRQIIEYQTQPSCRVPVSTPTLILQQVPSTSISIPPFLQPVSTTPSVQYVTTIDSTETPQYIATPDPMNPGTFRIQQSSVIQSIVPRVVGTIIQPPVEQIVTVNPQAPSIDFYAPQTGNNGVFLNNQPTVVGLEAVMNNSVVCNTVMNNTLLNNPVISNPVINNSLLSNSPVLSNTVINSPVLNNTVMGNPNIVSSSYQALTTHLLQASKPQVETTSYVIVNSQPNVNECHLVPSSNQSMRITQISQPNNWSINKHTRKTTKEVTTMYHSNAELIQDHKMHGQVNCVKVVKKKMTEETMIETASINNTFCDEVPPLPLSEDKLQTNSEVTNLTKLVEEIPAMFGAQSLRNPSPKPIVQLPESSTQGEIIDISASSDVQMEEACCSPILPASPLKPSEEETTVETSDPSKSLQEVSVQNTVKFSSFECETVEVNNFDKSVKEDIDVERSVSPTYNVSQVFSSGLNQTSPKVHQSKKVIPNLVKNEIKPPAKGKIVSTTDNLVNSRILKPTNKNGNTENKNSAIKSKNGNSISKSKSHSKNGKKCNAPKVVFEINSEDGFSYSTTSLADAWQKVFEAVQHARAIRKLPLLPHNPFKNAEASLRTLGLDNNGLKYLLEQLPGVGRCAKYKPTYHKSKVSQTKNDALLKENKSGCARSEPFTTRKEKYDMFSWLASRHRRPPKLLVASDADLINGNRRATSLNLPMAMRFRHLRETSKEAVGVFRSDIHGRGLFCLRDIDAGEMVIEYAGEVIRAALTDKRENFYNSKGIGCYMFRIDDYYVVDATLKGNAARFINHSCEPNCYSRIVDILGKKHILIFAQRRIPQGEELTYDYKFPLEEDKISCHCLSRKCRKYLN